MIRTCRQCGLEREHRVRSDSGKLQSKCNECLAAYGRRWRNENWRQRKAYDTWKGMLRRCYDRSTERWQPGTGVPSYRDYGALGITVCRRWRDDGNGFQNFLEDMGYPPDSEATLDRIRPSRGYAPSNTRWADRQTQNQNRKNTVWVTAYHPDTNEELTLGLGGWARVYGLKPGTVRKRVQRGWERLRAISEPVPSALVLEGVPF